MQERTPMTLRLPADLHEALKRIAEEEDRSLHNLIIRTLRQLVADRATESRPDR
jgi:predicted transcriptional regulator